MPSSATPVVQATSVAALRAALDDAGYTLQHIRPLLLAVSRGVGNSPLETLIRLFFLRAPAPLADAERALAGVGLDACQAMGLLTLGDTNALGTVQLLPDGDQLFASDGDPLSPDDLRVDTVMSPAGSTRLLGALTIRRPVELAVDLGTGCGYQAIRAAAHAARVIATDVNPRALAFTAFNLALNGITNVECRQSSWFDSLDDLRGAVDLVVCNPPYVITPDSETKLQYRDDHANGALSRHLVQTLPAYLRMGGLAHVLISWAHAADEFWAQPLEAWVAGNGCDAWLFRHASYDPPTYAATWNALLAQDPRRYADAIERWTHYFAEQGVARLAEGAIVLRRHARATAAIRFDDLPTGELRADAGEALAQRLLVEDRLAEIGGDDLLAERIEVMPDQRLAQILRYRGGRFHLTEALLVQEAGLRSTLECSALLLRLLSATDGQRRVAQVIEHALGSTGGDDSGQAQAALRAALTHGFLRLT